MMKLRMAEKRFQCEWADIKKGHKSLLNAEYLLKEIQLCESYLIQHPELRLPSLLVNSARTMLLSGINNYDRHKSLPLFLGWSELDVVHATLAKKKIPKAVLTEYRRYLSYSDGLKKHGAELIAEIG